MGELRLIPAFLTSIGNVTLKISYSNKIFSLRSRSGARGARDGLLNNTIYYTIEIVKSYFTAMSSPIVKCSVLFFVLSYVYQISTFAHENSNIFVIQRRIEQGEDESSYKDPPPSHYQYLYVCVLADSSCKRDVGEDLYTRRYTEKECQAFFPVFRNGSPGPSPASECCPPPLWFQKRGGGHTRLRERGRGSQFGRRDRHSGTLGIHPTWTERTESTCPITFGSLCIYSIGVVISLPLAVRFQIPAAVIGSRSWSGINYL
jgi:hypothetical protein